MEGAKRERNRRMHGCVNVRSGQRGMIEIRIRIVGILKNESHANRALSISTTPSVVNTKVALEAWSEWTEGRREGGRNLLLIWRSWRPPINGLVCSGYLVHVLLPERRTLCRWAFISSGSWNEFRTAIKLSLTESLQQAGQHAPMGRGEACTPIALKRTR